jgi:hypothetical protein
VVCRPWGIRSTGYDFWISYRLVNVNKPSSMNVY